MVLQVFFEYLAFFKNFNTSRGDLLMHKFIFNGHATNEQRDFFELWGFIIFRNVLNKKERDVILQEARKLTEDTLDGKIPQDEIDDLTQPGMDDNGNTILPDCHILINTDQ